MKKLALLVLVSMTLAGCGSLTSYAAKVNGRRITQNELDRELNAIRGNKAYLEQVESSFSQQTGERALGAGQGTFNTVFVAQVLERRIAFELVSQEVKRRKLEVTRKDLDEARSELVGAIEDEKVLEAFPRGYREELLRLTAEVAVLERALADPNVDDAEVKDYYEKNQASFQTNCVRHILGPDREAATRIKARVDAGEDFAAVARAESKDRQGPGGGSAAKGGDLGCAAKGSLIAPFEAALDKLQPGQVSDLVQTELGFHVVKLESRKTRSLEEATGEIRQRLQQEGQNALRNWISDAFSKAEVTVNPRYGEFVRSGDDFGIKAPKEIREQTPGPESHSPAPQP
ncbi:MAG: peptidyl-prolyl cis-trans isomerase [Actinomycetota bacterium]|nr:peptidyl-prolyl cis-trans isomerase [Actinomycetota bacterium]